MGDVQAFRTEDRLDDSCSLTVILLLPRASCLHVQAFSIGFDFCFLDCGLFRQPFLRISPGASSSLSVSPSLGESV